ncbi:putative nitrogen fixation protein NifT [Rhodobacter veldkampii DSM 11550]|uniref:Putative nitrogen fixation protein NifT n=1 Tax=Phaeovulum veldkampii DSM 11550 TaxID=1185920 RepID=A0A2T4JFW9_9RHOB|nr:putative nitrogen fixation protein NifT [Phaeovulum veldkampii]MBK5945153.1 putative nitrogen fixation protein NifT [Phaeovulum veldkampii DSM 11550]NCU21074.1 putative nitrogen fixation protein NifT [Candidatus Falkowbacteria bacterium]PTE16815.1 putative nitrogen fixation protein NifT [Phaeovulum veldkampii DSM 11550]TDQ54675.1 nitrogen fixation protein NifT [Phaeovulum veldkampii DSM 11550]
MKVMIRQTPKGLEAYVAKKDLEEMIVETETPAIWGGWARLSNGWVLDLPAFDTPPKLPITVEARKHPEAEG